MVKLIVTIMGDNCDRTMDMCIKSVLDTDKIVFCWGMNEALTQSKLNEWKEKLVEKFEIIQNEFNQEDKTMNGKQRNFYLNYLKENYPNDWALCIDADEVVEDLNKIKEFIQTAKEGLYSVKMRHFISDLGHEDSTDNNQGHFVPNRLFKISEADKYPEVEHPVLIPLYENQFRTDITTIWHLAYIPNLWEIKKRYENHLTKSNMHTPEYLKSWYYAHLFGQYPKKQIDILDIPSIILENFGINKDELYFANRRIEVKHPIMVKQWNDYFKPESVLDLGCGRGCYLYFWDWYCKPVMGIEISEWAVKNCFCNCMEVGDISDEKHYVNNDLITAIDVLEHLDNEQLDKTLKNMSKYGKKFLFSIPFVGDPNLEADKTHKQFKTREEWIKLIESYGIKIKETPSDWLFKEQILIGEWIN